MQEDLQSKKLNIVIFLPVMKIMRFYLSCLNYAKKFRNQSYSTTLYCLLSV